MDRVAVITGASRGLGAGLAERFLERGVSVALCARSELPFADGERVLVRRLDVTDAAAVDAFAAAVIARFGRIDVWVNNAGVLAPIAPLRDVDPAAFAGHLAVNVMGVMHGSQAFVRHVRGRPGEGVLFNISSGAARAAYSGWSAYCASKAAVDRLTECIAIEEAGAGVRPYALAPGVIDTDMQDLIRATPQDRFPDLPKFLRMKEEGSFSSARWVADGMLEMAFGPDPGRWPVLHRLPAEI